MGRPILLAIAISVAVVYPAHSQIQSGIILVFTYTQGVFVIAADSRQIHTGTKPTPPPSDTYCKIVALGGRVIFASTGATSLKNEVGLPNWSSTDEAAKATRLIPMSVNGANVNAVADSWSQAIAGNWRLMQQRLPEEVSREAAMEDGSLTVGIFASVENGRITVAMRRVIFDAASHSIITRTSVECPLGAWCAAGKTAVFHEFLNRTSPRARADSETWDTHPPRTIGDALPFAIHLVDLTIAYDPDGDVGGQIDALALKSDGSIYWRQRKPNCAEKED